MYCDIPEFGRCCFCLPLRRGVQVFGCINVFFSAFMIGVYSYYSHHEISTLIYKGVVSSVSNPWIGFCIAIYCIETLINCLLVYGTHVKNITLLKVFYYYTMTSMVAAVVLQIIEAVNYLREPEMLILAFSGFCIQFYLLLLVRSLLKKLDQGSEHSIENQLHTIVLGEPRIDNRVYNHTTMTPLKDNFYCVN